MITPWPRHAASLIFAASNAASSLDAMDIRDRQ
jgi:hypothetical protein